LRGLLLYHSTNSGSFGTGAGVPPPPGGSMKVKASLSS